MYYKTASIILNSNKKANSISDIFISQPDKGKEALAGKLFVLAEIESQKSEAIKIINFLVNNLNFNYYQNDKIILKEKIESITVESIFETSLAKTNKDLLEFLEREKIKIHPSAFNITICVLHKNDIYFSSVGKNKNLLIYKEKIEAQRRARKEALPDEETIEYKIINISQDKEKNSETINLNKIFSDIVSGKIPTGGYFLIINEAISEYVSNKQLVKIITTISPVGAAEQIKNNLRQVNAFVSFLGIIIKNTSNSFSSEELQKEFLEIEKENYQPKITDIEEKTEEILRPAGIINLKKSFENLTRRISQTKSNRLINMNSKGEQKTFMFKEKVFFKKRIPSFKIIYLFIIDFFQGIFSLLLFPLKKIMKKKITDKSGEEIRQINEKGVKNSISGKKKLKIILIIAFILLIIFITNTISTDKKNKAEEKRKKFNALISLIEKNQNKIDADLLYNNENKARELVKENEDLLKKISDEERKNKSAVNDLFKKQEDQIEKISHIIKIESLKEIADFSNLNNRAAPENIFFSNNKIYSADSKEKSIYKIDLKENIVTAIYNFGGEIEELKYPTVNSKNELYYLDKKNVIILNEDGEITITKIDYTSETSDISAIENYGNNIYILNKKDGQVYKHFFAGDSFLAGEKWLNQAENLSDAVDLFVDGNIYLFYKNGKIEKYLKGGKQEFSIEAIYDPIENASRFTIGEEYIYIMEPAKKRIISFNKEGKFVEQYIFPSLDKIGDFAINENDKKIYILNGNSVYESNFGKE